MDNICTHMHSFYSHYTMLSKLLKTPLTTIYWHRKSLGDQKKLIGKTKKKKHTRVINRYSSSFFSNHFTFKMQTNGHCFKKLCTNNAKKIRFFCISIIIPTYSIVWRFKPNRLMNLTFWKLNWCRQFLSQCVSR